MGCLPRDTDLSVLGSECFVASTQDASDPATYRHFAVDDDNGVLYYCDRNPYLMEQLCYSSNITEGTNSWHGRKQVF
jgi:hypothetical protein